MKFDYSSRFKKQYKKLPEKIKAKVNEKLLIFVEDEFNLLLKSHKLHGEYSSYRGISITGDIRVVYKKIDSDILFLQAVGSHSELFS